MPASPDQIRTALTLVTSAAVASAAQVAGTGDFGTVALLVPEVVGYYSDGSSALAADWYDDVRDDASARGSFVAQAVVVDRSEKLRRSLLWAVEPLKDGNVVEMRKRLDPVVQKATARPFWDTVTGNVSRDDAAVGWSRHTRPNGCSFCRMLSDRGAVYKVGTARFAAHGNCHCTARPEFGGGREASAVQYVASQRRRSPAERKAVRDYMAAHYGP